MAHHVSPHAVRLARALREPPTEARLYYGETARVPTMRRVMDAASSRKSDEAIMMELFIARDWEALDAFAPATR